MPVYLDGTLIWTDCLNSFSLHYEPLVLYEHLVHVYLLLTESYKQKATGLWMPCGDIFPDGTVVQYRLTEFGSKFLVISKGDTELVLHITEKVIQQIELLIRSITNE